MGRSRVVGSGNQGEFSGGRLVQTYDHYCVGREHTTPARPVFNVMTEGRLGIAQEVARLPSAHKAVLYPDAEFPIDDKVWSEGVVDLDLCANYTANTATPERAGAHEM